MRRANTSKKCQIRNGAVSSPYLGHRRADMTAKRTAGVTGMNMPIETGAKPIVRWLPADA